MDCCTRRHGLATLRSCFALVCSATIVSAAPRGASSDLIWAQVLERVPEREPRPVIIDLRVETRSLRNAQDVRAALEAIGPRPDHPERRALEYHAQLLNEPDAYRVRVAFESARLWRLDTERPDFSFVAAGHDDVRWMRPQIGGAGQLTAIREGVPFPAVYNVSRFLDEARSLRSKALGVPTWPAVAPIVEPGPPDGDRFAVSLRGERGWSARVDLDLWSGTTAVIVRAIDSDGKTYEFEEYKWNEAVQRPLPSRIIETTADGVRTATTVVGVETIERQSLEELASLPEPRDGETFADLRQPGGPLAELYADGQTMTWEHGADGGDRFRVQAGGPLEGDAKKPAGTPWLPIVFAGALLVVGGLIIRQRSV